MWCVNVSTAGGDQDADNAAADAGDRDASSAKLLTTSVRGNAGERILKALTKVDEKKKKRNTRQKQVNLSTLTHELHHLYT